LKLNETTLLNRIWQLPVSNLSWDTDELTDFYGFEVISNKSVGGG
jgi:hypothetical protein